MAREDADSCLAPPPLLVPRVREQAPRRRPVAVLVAAHPSQDVVQGAALALLGLEQVVEHGGGQPGRHVLDGAEPGERRAAHCFEGAERRAHVLAVGRRRWRVIFRSPS